MRPEIWPFTLCLLACAVAGPPAVLHAQKACDVEHMVWENVLSGKQALELGHTSADAAAYIRVSSGGTPSKIAPYPDVLSEQHQEAIMEARALYLKGDYVGASRALAVPYAEEPGNPFILNEYARALYWDDAQADQSLKVYRQLIELLDAQSARRLGRDVVYIDAWFGEAYWKLGTLYLDNGAHSLGIYEISRALLANAGQSNPAFLEQAFAFLAEAYLEVGQYPEARCLTDQVLKLNPKNPYALSYLEFLKQAE